MTKQEVLRELCQGFQARQSELQLGPGKKRDDAMLHYFIGAARMAEALDYGKVRDYLQWFIREELSKRGYKAVQEVLDGTDYLA